MSEELKDPNQRMWHIWTIAFVAIAVAEWLELVL